MVTFDEARALVDAAERPGFDRDDYVVLGDGREDDTYFQVFAGSARDFDPETPTEELSTDVLVRLVEKSSGLIRYANPIDVFDIPDGMTPVTG